MSSTVGDVEDMLEELLEEKAVSFDTETTGLSPYKSNVAGYVFGTASKGWYVPVYHSKRVFSERDSDTVVGMLRSSGLFTKPSIRKVFFNYKFDLKMLRREGFDVGPQETVEDGGILFRLLEKPWRNNGLKHLSREYLKRDTLGDELLHKELLGQDKGLKDRYGYATLPPALVGLYACDDAILTMALFNHLMNKFSTDINFGDIWRLYRIEMEVCRNCADMEDAGIHVDLDYLRGLKTRLDDELLKVRESCKVLTKDKNFNVLSSDNLIEALSERGVKLTERTDKGQLRVDEGTLRGFSDDELVGMVLRYRELTKLKSTYVESIMDSHVGGVLHPEFRTIEAETGRFSCTRPSIQTIPRKHDEFSIRKAFVTPPGSRLFFFDFSQQELRIFGHYADDPQLLEIFKSGKDYHQATAEMIGTDRSKAKTINFGLLYGMGAKKLANSLSISEDEAKGVMERYFNALPGAKRVIKTASDAVKKRGWIRTHFWRRRWLNYEDEFKVKQEGQHKALNTIIQGTCADINKICINRCSDYLNSLDLPHRGRVHLIMSIHDELVFQIPVGLEYVVPTIKALMEDFPEFKVPLEVEVSYTATNWDEKKKLTGSDIVAMTMESLSSDRVFTDELQNPYKEPRHEFKGIFDRKLATGTQKGLFDGRM